MNAFRSIRYLITLHLLCCVLSNCVDIVSLQLSWADATLQILLGAGAVINTVGVMADIAILLVVRKLEPEQTNEPTLL